VRVDLTNPVPIRSGRLRGRIRGIETIAPNFTLFSLLAVVVLVVVVVVVVVVAATHKSNPPPPSPPLPPQRLTSSALSELDLRYARGEIERDDYLRRRSDILGQ
jgi:uncharacterized membrane protein